jgi:hypothetical protein
MRLLVLAAAATALALTGPATAKPRATGEAKLAKMLEGRVAGQPSDCIRTWPNKGMTTIDGTAFVFGHGDVIYVNRTTDPASIDEDDALVIRKFGSGTELCRTDIVRTFDTATRFSTGNVFLTDFVPYRRVGR